MTAELIQSVSATYGQPCRAPVDKWAVFRDLCTARATFDVSDRDLTVLNALLSFHPETQLQPQARLIVFPSNASLATRAHGMAESTLRRHLAALVAAGLILRHDSPNGKRYARRATKHAAARAFGFDLRPLLVRAGEIAEAAEDAAEAANALRSLREKASLLRRDAVKLIDHRSDRDAAQHLDRLNDIRRALRRKIGLAEVTQLIDEMTELLDEYGTETTVHPEKMSGCDGQNERHHKSSYKESIDMNETGLNLGTVIEACPDLTDLVEDIPTNWHQMVGLAHRLHGMIGIGQATWQKALTIMGPCRASVAICCILQRLKVIRNPGGYLTRLIDKAAQGAFSPDAMVQSLLRASPS